MLGVYSCLAISMWAESSGSPDGFRKKKAVHPDRRVLLGKGPAGGVGGARPPTTHADRQITSWWSPGGIQAVWLYFSEGYVSEWHAIGGEHQERLRNRRSAS